MVLQCVFFHHQIYARFPILTFAYLDSGVPESIREVTNSKIIVKYDCGIGVSYTVSSV